MTYTQALGNKLPVILFDLQSTMSSCKKHDYNLDTRNTDSIPFIFFALGFGFPCIRNMEIIQCSYLFNHFDVVRL